MKNKCKRLTALVLALAMCLSLLSATVWAANVEAEEELTAEVVAEATEEVAEEEPAEEKTDEAEPVEEAAVEESEDAEEETVVSAAEDETEESTEIASGTCGENLTWVLSEDRVLTISGTGAMNKWNIYSSVPWYSYRSSITSVTIEDGVTSIGNYAFYSCTGLTSVAIPDGVTSIGDFAFDSCTKLTSVAIPDGVVFIGEYAFYGCTSLTSVTIPDSVTSIGYYAFRSCTKLTSVTIGSGVTSIEFQAFAWCESLTSITVDEENTAYSSLDGVLFNKDQTELICYPGGKSGEYVIPDGVTSIGEDAFYNCKKLTSVTIPDSVTSIGGSAFNNCIKLTSVTIGSGVTSIGFQAFRSCWGLTSVTIPDSVISISLYAFYGCTGLTSVTIPDSVTFIGRDVFTYCKNLTSITVDEENTAYSSLDGVLFNKDQTELICYPGGKSGEYVIPDGVTSIGEDAFEYCTKLTSAIIPDSVTSIGELAFYGCTSLTDITIGSGVTSIGMSAFHKTPWLEAQMEAQPDECVIVNGILYVYQGSNTSVTIPDGVTSISDSFFCLCLDITSVTIPDSVTSIGAEAFSGCSNLTSVTIGSGVTSIGVCAFDYCTSLTDVYYSGSKDDWAAISIGKYNTWLTNATIHYAVEDTQADLSTCTISLSATSYTYDGKAKQPTVTVKDADGNTLTEGTDYTVAYSNNTNYGTGKVTITGIGNYTGTVEKTFSITYATPTLSSVSNTTSGVKVSWKAVTGAAKYRVFRKTGSGSWTKLGDTTSTSYTDKTAKSGTTYTYTVRCINSAGTSYTSSYNKTGKAIKYLTAGKISSLTNTSSGITVKWSKVSGASGYKIYRKTSSGSYSLIKTITSGSTVSYTDTAVKSKNGTTYVYAVRPYSGSYTGSYTGKTTVRLTGVSISSLTNVKTKKMTVKWGKNAKATGYQIQYSTSSTFASGNKTVTVSGSSSVSKTISSLTKNKKYYVRVRAYKTVSGTKYYSAWSSTKNVKISK